MQLGMYCSVMKESRLESMTLNLHSLTVSILSTQMASHNHCNSSSRYLMYFSGLIGTHHTNGMQIFMQNKNENKIKFYRNIETEGHAVRGE